LPGNHDVLGVDMGSGMGTGIFDISGNTGTFRSKFTGIYTGSSIAFANASEMYSYDSDTTGGEFYRWTVGINGLTAIDGSTLSGFGGFAGGFKVANGLVYGIGGGLADPGTTPPSELGQYQISSSLGVGQTVEANAVA